MLKERKQPKGDKMNTWKQYQNTRSPIRRKALAEQLYLEFFNDFLTISRFAEYYEADEAEICQALKEGKHWNNLPKIEAVTA